MKKFNLLMGSFLCIMVGAFTSCEQEVIEPTEIEDADQSNLRTTLDNTVYGDRNVWFSHSDGTYWNSLMSEDFGNTRNYDDSDKERSYISNNTLRITLLKNLLISHGGITASVRLSKGNGYSLEYKVKFQDKFEWARGGKLPGLAGGAAYTGGQSSLAGDGWSFRVMWRQYGNDSPYLEPYCYYHNQPDKYGDSFSSKYTISDNTWYTVFIKAKMNTGTNDDGLSVMKVNGNLVWEKTNMHWVSKDAGREIDLLLWHFFRGGSSDDFKASVDNYIYIDDVKINKI